MNWKKDKSIENLDICISKDFNMSFCVDSFKYNSDSSCDLFINIDTNEEHESFYIGSYNTIKLAKIRAKELYKIIKEK